MIYRHPLMLSAVENRVIRWMLINTGAAATVEGRELMRKLEDHFGPAFRGATQRQDHGEDERGADRR